MYKRPIHTIDYTFHTLKVKWKTIVFDATKVTFDLLSMNREKKRKSYGSQFHTHLLDIIAVVECTENMI